MMRVQCKRLMDGPGPREQIVAIVTSGGKREEIVVDNDLVHDGYLEVGPAIGTRNGDTLIELPRESASGQWRVWVKSNITKESLAAVA